MEFKSAIKLIAVILLVSVFIFSAVIISNILSTLATPYSLSESIYWLVKNFTGLSKKNAGIVESIPNSYILNENLKTRYRLVFLGDLMPIGKRLINIGDGLKAFLSDADYLIVNLEGIITENRKGSPVLISDRRHERSLIAALAEIFPPEKTCLSVANNHAADFGKEEFFDSIKLLESHDFNVFGWNNKPFFDIDRKIRIISATAWSNRSCDYLPRLKDAANYIENTSFNILYPHFGYEFELYPRPETVKIARGLLDRFGALIGHHPHCPQPVSSETIGGANKLIAYSLGNFCSVRKSKKYRYGIALKVTVGESDDGEWRLGKVEWRLIKSNPLPNGEFQVILLDKST